MVLYLTVGDGKCLNRPIFQNSYPNIGITSRRGYQPFWPTPQRNVQWRDFWQAASSRQIPVSVGALVGVSEPNFRRLAGRDYIGLCHLRGNHRRFWDVCNLEG